MTEKPARKRPSSNARYSAPNAATAASAYIHNGRSFSRTPLLTGFVLQRALPTTRPPRRRRRRAVVGERERPELVQRAHVHGTLEIDDLLDRPPVIHPATAIEFGLGAEIEAHALDR